MIRIDTDSYKILGQKYGLPSQKCGMSDLYCVWVIDLLDRHTHRAVTTLYSYWRGFIVQHGRQKKISRTQTIACLQTCLSTLTVAQFILSRSHTATVRYVLHYVTPIFIATIWGHCANINSSSLRECGRRKLGLVAVGLGVNAIKLLQWKQHQTQSNALISIIV